MSVSIDGEQEPQLWIEDDILDLANNPGGFEPSPIALINGEEPVEYLIRFAAINSQGTLEPHADWNQLMGSPAMDIQGSVNSFSGGATFYPGDELNFTMANGTNIATNWVAVYNELNFTGPLATGGGLLQLLRPGSLACLVRQRASVGFFQQLGQLGGRLLPRGGRYLHDELVRNYAGLFLGPHCRPRGPLRGERPGRTGYLLPDISTGVLSLPTFNQFDTTKETFIDAINNLIENATTHGMQQNWGGDVMLAFAGSAAISWPTSSARPSPNTGTDSRSTTTTRSI